VVVGDSQQAAAKFVRRKRQFGCTMIRYFGTFLEGQSSFAVVGIAVKQAIDGFVFGNGGVVEKA
jgi:hypothetical protein